MKKLINFFAGFILMVVAIGVVWMTIVALIAGYKTATHNDEYIYKHANIGMSFKEFEEITGGRNPDNSQVSRDDEHGQLTVYYGDYQYNFVKGNYLLEYYAEPTLISVNMF